MIKYIIASIEGTRYDLAPKYTGKYGKVYHYGSFDLIVHSCGDYPSGEYEEAYRLLNHYLADEIHIEYENLSSGDKDYKQKYNKGIARIIDEFKPFYELLGKDIPDNIKNVTYELSQILYDS